MKRRTEQNKVNAKRTEIKQKNKCESAKNKKRASPLLSGSGCMSLSNVKREEMPFFTREPAEIRACKFATRVVGISKVEN